MIMHITAMRVLIKRVTMLSTVSQCNDNEYNSDACFNKTCSQCFQQSVSVMIMHITAMRVLKKRVHNAFNSQLV